MDRQFATYYEQELRHLRETSGEFAREFPKIAQRLALDGFGCADPYVERLLEGFAFLAARVHHKLDAEFPRFTQSLLSTIYPVYLMPAPSMAIVEFQPDPAESGLADGVPIPRDTLLRSVLGKGERTACQFRTAHDVTLWPLTIAEAAYHTRDLGQLDLPAGLRPKAALRLRLEATGGLMCSAIAADELVLFLRGADGALPMRVYEQCFARCTGMVLQPVAPRKAFQEVLPASSVRQIGFGPGEALLPYDPRTFDGYRMLREYFAFSERFMFLGLGGLAAGLKRCQDNRIDIILTFDESDVTLEKSGVSAGNFCLNCTPAINMFPKRADRISLSNRFAEFHVVPDRTRPLDFEVLSVTGVQGYSADLADEQPFEPFYAASDFDAGGNRGKAYYTVHRVPRRPAEREIRHGPRSSYRGGEVYLTLVDSQAAPFRSDLRELAVSVLCSNRDLPTQMVTGEGRTDFTLDINAPVTGVRCLVGPTAPLASHGERLSDWRVISHMTLNYLSLVDTNDGRGAEALRDILRLYSDPRSAELQKQVDGLSTVASQPVVRRLSRDGPVSFVRGLEVALSFNEDAFRGTGLFLLGAVLERFLGGYVSVNSFTETVVRSTDRGEVMRWPARSGIQPLV